MTQQQVSDESPGGLLFPEYAALYDLIAAEVRGSIHQVGAFVQKAPACNGWQFWYVDVKGSLVPIDVLRQKLRAELH